MMHGKFNVDECTIITYQSGNRNTRSVANDKQLATSRARTESMRSWFSERISDVWNNLPAELKSIKPKYSRNGINTNVFKCALVKHFHMLSKKFEIENVCSWRVKCRCCLCRVE